MVFSSFEFLFRFLPFFLLIYYVTPQKWKNAVLFAGSILFYTAGEAEYVVLLLASVVINYVFGRLMYRDTYEGRGKKQLILLIVALCYDFGVLFLFKYSGFMDKLPLGISFYTFQIAAYIIDVVYPAWNVCDDVSTADCRTDHQLFGGPYGFMQQNRYFRTV